MTACYRSTTLNLAAKNCPRALDYYEADEPVRDRTYFETGIAAHSVIQGVGEETNRRGRELEPEEVQTVARAVVKKLLAEGRSFEGRPEPPMSSDSAWAGRDVALSYLLAVPLQPGAQYEVGLAVDADWQPVEYDSPEARYRAIIDYLEIGTSEDEETGFRVAVVRDWKSSWATDEKELHTVQRRGQALLAWAHFGPLEGMDVQVDVVRQEVVNLRTWKLYQNEIHTIDPEGVDQLDQWRLDLDATMATLDEQKVDGQRPAIVGARCVGCPYVGICEPALEFVWKSNLSDDPAMLARGYASAKARADELRDHVKRVADGEPIDTGDAYVGTQPQLSRTLKLDAYDDIVAAWEVSRGEIHGFARALKLSVANATALAKELYPDDREGREDWVDGLTEPVVRRRFDIRRKEVSS